MTIASIECLGAEMGRMLAHVLLFAFLFQMSKAAWVLQQMKWQNKFIGSQLKSMQMQCKC